MQIATDDIERLHQTLETNGNWTEILTPFGIEDDDLVRQDPAVFAKRLNAAIGNPDGDRLDKIRNVLPGFDPPRMHPVAEAVFRHYGVSTIDMAILTAAGSRTFTVETDDGAELGFWHSQQKPESTTSIHMTRDVLWEHSDDEHSIEIFTPVPATLLHGMAGEPLARIVSHPAFDGLGLRVSRASTVDRNAGDSTYIELEPYAAEDREGAR